MQTINAGNGVEKKEAFDTVGGNINFVQPLWRTVWRFLKQLRIELSYDLVIPFLSIYLEKTWFERIHAPQCLPQYSLQ